VTSFQCTDDVRAHCPPHESSIEQTTSMRLACPKSTDSHEHGDAGQYEEALRRRKEAELSRAQLQQKIESLKQARSSGHPTGDDLNSA